MTNTPAYLKLFLRDKDEEEKFWRPRVGRGSWRRPTGRPTVASTPRSETLESRVSASLYDQSYKAIFVVIGAVSQGPLTKAESSVQLTSSLLKFVL